MNKASENNDEIQLIKKSRFNYILNHRGEFPRQLMERLKDYI